MNSDAKILLSSVITIKRGKGYYSFANRGGKLWVMPKKNMTMAMNLYQPSGIKGKSVRTLFPYIHRIPLVRSVIHAEEIDCTIRNDLHKLLCEVFDVNDFEYSLFGGTPGIHQKITIQIYQGKKILGYCKVCSTQKIFSLFEGEAKMLTQLHKKGVANIPESLFCDKLENELGVFIQTTVKTNYSKNVHEWTASHNVFLKDFCKKTLQKIKFEKSDFYHMLCDFEKNMNWISNKSDQSVIKQAIELIIGENQGKEVLFCAYHADFTPWNMFIEKNKLFVFDFEYAQGTCPMYMDFFHYITQIGIFEKKMNSAQLWEWVNKATKEKAFFIKNKNRLYICYLLHIIYFYFKINRGDFCSQDRGYQCRIKLLVKLLNV